MKRTSIMLLAGLMIGLAIPAQAERINSRLEQQSGRIGRDMSNHDASNAAAMRADERAAKIANEEQNMRTRHNGKLTRHDRAKLNRQLNANAAMLSNAERRHHHRKHD